jgi:penicillin amidase
MNTSAEVFTSSRRRFRGWRVIAVAFALAVLAMAGAAGWFYWAARSALPQLDGRIEVSGLSAPVSVIRDSHGVPTIEAAGLPDLFFAQGYVTAQDRLWQMDIMRRAAAGELSEILGPETIRFDREQRILGLREAAHKQVESSTPEDKSNFAAYARGVNAFISSHRDRLPLEFRILRYSPKLWMPEDSALIAAQMVKDLNHNPHEIVREKILAKLGSELTSDLYVNSSWHDHPPTVSAAPLDSGSSDGDDQEDGADTPSSVTQRELPTEMDRVGADPPSILGSNNWVVSGAHTVSGKPLLSNDMHLEHQMPNLWYEAHLRSGGFDVAGVTLPGVPYVIVGHNQRIAWGFTNVGPTVEDLYIETFNPSGQYLTPQGWKEPEHRHEVIHVKGEPDVSVDVVITRHGPIVTELLPGEIRKLALRWTLYDGIGNPFFAVDSAQNWDEFRQAFSRFEAPGQNVVYADVDGNIGYQATGKVPIRASGDGSLPENGSDDTHEWIGYIPFEKLPSVFNPPSGVIATANSRITPDGYPYSISAQWEAPWRSDRIYRVLQSGRQFSTADMLALQTDIYSEWDRFVADRLVYAVDHAANASARAREATDILRNWDGRMSIDSAAPSIVTRSRMELSRLLLEPKLGPAPEGKPRDGETLSWKSYRWGMQSIWLENVLLHQPKQWLPANYSDYNALLTAAVEAAVNAPDASKTLASWKWGNNNPVEIQNPVLSHIPIVGRWSGPGVHPQSGSGYTVKAVSKYHGPSERMTVDLKNLDDSTLNVVTGESGNFLSPYYMDQWRAWYEGTTFAFPFSPEAVRKSETHHLTLQPAR